MPRKENFLYYEHHTKHQVNRACDETQLFIVTAAYAAVTWPFQRINSHAENFTSIPKLTVAFTFCNLLAANDETQ